MRRNLDPMDRGTFADVSVRCPGCSLAVRYRVGLEEPLEPHCRACGRSHLAQVKAAADVLRATIARAVWMEQKRGRLTPEGDEAT